MKAVYRVVAALIVFASVPALAQMPAAPMNLTVMPGSAGGAVIHWDSSMMATSYTLYKSVDGLSFYVLAMTPHTSFFDFQVGPGHGYRYFVRAMNMSGGSGPSDTVTFTMMPPPPPPGPHGVFRGHVSDDSTGFPVSFATLRFFNVRTLWITQTHADSAGNYRAAVDTGRYLIQAERFGYVPEWYQNAFRPADAAVVELHEDSVTVDFGLTHLPPPPPPASVSGVVRDSITGNPLANALVAFVRPPHVFRELEHMLGMFGGLFDERMMIPGFGYLHGVVWAGLTDSGGAYTAHIRPGETYLALAFKPGYVHKFYRDAWSPFDADRIVVQGDSAGFDFNLIPNPFAVNMLSGTVEDSSGTGIPSHVVLVRLTPLGPLVVRYSVSDSLGNYTFSNLVAGKFAVKAVPLDGYAPAWYAAAACGIRSFHNADTVTVSGNTAGIDICVTPLSGDGFCRVAGMVSLGGGGGGLAKASGLAAAATQGVTVYAVSDATGAVAGYDISESDGSYAIEHLAPGSYTLVADKEGYASAAGSVTVDGTNGYEESNAPVTVTPESPTSAGETGPLPARYSLAQNYPNPFNPSTLISFELPAASTVSVAVYNVLGQLVTDLVHGTMAAGVHEVTWNGMDRNGRQMGSGVYFIKMEASAPGGAAFSQTRKAILMK